ncbi:hypothetical protein [Burkholderia cenocepacia]|uniref:hypothetical protein n=1 Tax=Burkholderia cenocepacia TaxID=95486 RepID=UPI00287541E5|nr:hypothetical protein [Burkholderia cenocepacia]MDS0807532.1 hypothetical protein [Burkholderia cenocepacia]
MLEKTVETYLVDRVRAAGGDAYKFTSPARVSVPDRIVVFPPARIYFVELKRPGGKLTRGQEREHERLRALGCDVRTLDSREAVDAFVREASTRRADALTDALKRLSTATIRYAQAPKGFNQTANEAFDELRQIEREILTIAASPPSQPAAAPIRCSLCDNTGDIHDATGEWRGECPNCAPADERAAFAKFWREVDEMDPEETARAAFTAGVAFARTAPSPADERAAFVRHQGYERPQIEGAAQEAWDYHRKTWLAALVFARSPAQQPEPLVLTSAEFSTGAVREAVEQGLWAADVKLTDDAWRNIEALLVEQARVDALKAARAGGAA